MDIEVIGNNEKLSVNEILFDSDYKEGLIHQVVTTFLNNARSGNSAQKTRSEVRGGGAKPWRQKGTGRARAGTIRSPIWRSGGVTFAAKKRDYTKKINKKMYSKAICSIISELYRNGHVIVVKELNTETPKTKDFKESMKQLNVDSALVITAQVTENDYLSSRNLHEFDVCDTVAIDPVSLLMHKKVVMTEAAIKQLEEQLL